MNPVFALFIGAAFTAALSIPATLFVERRRIAARSEQDLTARRAEASATRQLLHQENQHNLGGLREYMRRVEQGLPGTYEAERIEWRLRVVEQDLPVWSHDFRNQPTPLLPLADSETDRPKLFALHDGLDRLTALRAKLQQAFTDDIRAVAVACRKNPEMERVGSLPVTPGGQAYQEARAFATKVREFNNQTQELQVEWQGICNTLLPMMGPVGGRHPARTATTAHSD
jgi:hypothetical protein